MKIAIDAGHGSNTPGKRTPDGYREHYGNVMCAVFFAKAMERCGVAYIKTGWNDENSKDDEDVSLSARQKAIKAAGCDYSISFHFNAYGDGNTFNTAEGIETLYSNKYPGDSKRMAERIHAELIKGTTQKNRGVKAQRLAMCDCNAMKTKASVLVECAFMTNKREAELMKSLDYCKECAEEAAKGFCAYVSVKYVPEKVEVAPVQPTFLPYKVRVANVAKDDTLNIREEPKYDSKKTGELKWDDDNVYTIIEEKNGWGRLKSKIGWIKLSYTTRL